MQNDSKIVKIEVSPEFKRSLRSLAKRYRNIRSDIQPIIDALQAGNVVGDQIPDVGYSVFKVRIKNSNNQKGKSGGYRFIYYLKTDTQIVLITVYSKSDQGDISVETIHRIIANFESQ